jgi:acetyl-CoA synthetase
MTSPDNTDTIPCNTLPFVSQSLSHERYDNLYARSISDADGFWGDIAGEFTWKKRWDHVNGSDFSGDVAIRWFEGGLLNITENCLDRHLEARGDKPAYIWEGDDPTQRRILTYRELYHHVNRFASGLRALGVKKGDRVTLYMPQIPEAVIAMLACARIGAIHSVVFAGFSADSVRSRIEDCNSDVIITADAAMRGGKPVPLKAQIDSAIKGLNIRHVIVFSHVGLQVEWVRPRDIAWQEVINGQPDTCAAEVMASEDPLFILYTSGSTGKPKGLLHTVAGYMVYVATTMRYAFDLREEDIYWCTADIGWITGHSYMVYGPLLNGATSVLFEGIPTYPDASRYWKVVDAYRVSIFYTAPTAVRSLMRLGNAPVTATSRASLRVLGSVGEPINPEAWLWYFRVVGESRCPIVDTWWQTETGGHMILPLPGITPQKPGAASWPFFGVIPKLYSADGECIEGAGEGMLCIARSWPGQARTIWGDHDRFRKTYFSTIKGAYFTSDGARRDADGYYWITGRVDDVINVSGHRLGTAEIESALVAHPDVAEAAVVGVAHEVKGQAIYAYVIVNASVETTDAAALKLWVRKQIGGLAVPEVIHFTPALPKTRSGKIMRRILRKIAEGDVESLGDTSTLMNPEIIAELLSGRGI